MAIVYREEKGSPLTAAEMDGNFAQLERRITALEAERESPESIASITLEGDDLIITGTHGSTWGPLQVPGLRNQEPGPRNLS